MSTVADGAFVPEVVLRARLARDGVSVHVLDGSTVGDRASAYDALTDALSLPDWFGRNLDALADCVGDLSWLAGDRHALLWRRWGHFVAANPDDAADIGAVLDEADPSRLLVVRR